MCFPHLSFAPLSCSSALARAVGILGLVIRRTQTTAYTPPVDRSLPLIAVVNIDPVTSTGPYQKAARSRLIDTSRW
jgi:hypothetical protein